MWEDSEAGEKVTVKSVESLEATLSDINKESFWFDDCGKFQVRAERARDMALGCLG
jgi:hypothetical protein